MFVREKRKQGGKSEGKKRKIYIRHRKKSNGVGKGIERQRVDSVFTAVCFAIEYRLDFGLGLRVRRYPVETSGRGIPGAATGLTLVDSQAYRSEFRGGYLENPRFESRLVLIGLMKLRFMTDSRC